jgi:hypothetical protein
MLESIVAILAGLVLLAGVFQSGTTGSRVASVLVPFQGVIGLIALVVGVLNFFNIIGLALIVAGLILAAEALAGIPEIGDELKRAGQALSGIGGLVGAVLLVLALYRLIQGAF